MARDDNSIRQKLLAALETSLVPAGRTAVGARLRRGRHVIVGTDAPGIVAYGRINPSEVGAGFTIGPVANLAAYGCPPSMVTAWNASTRGEGPDDPGDEPRPDINTTPLPRTTPRP